MKYRFIEKLFLVVGEHKRSQDIAGYDLRLTVFSYLSQSWTPKRCSPTFPIAKKKGSRHCHERSRLSATLGGCLGSGILGGTALQLFYASSRHSPPNSKFGHWLWYKSSLTLTLPTPGLQVHCHRTAPSKCPGKVHQSICLLFVSG